MEFLSKILRIRKDKDEDKKEKGYFTLSCPPGKMWNPMRKFPANKPCFCGSEVKAKFCCKPHLNKIVSQDFSYYIKENWEKLLSGEMTLPPYGREA